MPVYDRCCTGLDHNQDQKGPLVQSCAKPHAWKSLHLWPQRCSWHYQPAWLKVPAGGGALTAA